MLSCSAVQSHCPGYTAAGTWTGSLSLATPVGMVTWPHCPGASRWHRPARGGGCECLPLHSAGSLGPQCHLQPNPSLAEVPWGGMHSLATLHEDTSHLAQTSSLPPGPTLENSNVQEDREGHASCTQGALIPLTQVTPSRTHPGPPPCCLGLPSKLIPSFTSRKEFICG